MYFNGGYDIRYYIGNGTDIEVQYIYPKVLFLNLTFPQSALCAFCEGDHVGSQRDCQ
jgi:hypothetical protein